MRYFFILLLFSCTGSEPKKTLLPVEESALKKEIENGVFICNSLYASKYHFTTNCVGLDSCTHEIIEISLDNAKYDGWELCGYENEHSK